MPRRARLSLPGIPWHIIQRGNNRGVCFYTEDDYRRYLDDLSELAPRFGCAVHAYENVICPLLPLYERR
jgi:putative transposase